MRREQTFRGSRRQIWFRGRTGAGFGNGSELVWTLWALLSSRFEAQHRAHGQAHERRFGRHGAGL